MYPQQPNVLTKIWRFLGPGWGGRPRCVFPGRPGGCTGWPIPRAVLWRQTFVDFPCLESAPRLPSQAAGFRIRHGMSILPMMMPSLILHLKTMIFLKVIIVVVFYCSILVIIGLVGWYFELLAIFRHMIYYWLCLLTGYRLQVDNCRWFDSLWQVDKTISTLPQCQPFCNHLSKYEPNQYDVLTDLPMAIPIGYVVNHDQPASKQLTSCSY